MDKELREKIADICLPEWDNSTVWRYESRLTTVTRRTDAILSLVSPLLAEEARKERERIINLLQDLLEASERVKEPSIKVRMMNVLQALKGEK